jgi:hypothetical protein
MGSCHLSFNTKDGMHLTLNKIRIHMVSLCSIVIRH